MLPCQEHHNNDNHHKLKNKRKHKHKHILNDHNKHNMWAKIINVMYVLEYCFGECSLANSFLFVKWNNNNNNNYNIFLWIGVILVALYVISPIDLVSDFLLFPFSFLDDILLVVFLVFIIQRFRQ